MEDPAGYDPVAAGLKGQSLSIRVYARGPVARDARQGPAFERVDHGVSSKLVRQSGIEPASHGHRPRSLPLRYKRSKVVRPAGDDPAASRMSGERSAAELKTRVGAR